MADIVVVKEESLRLTPEASDGEASLAVVERIAALEGTDPVELPPLYDTVDPDALDSLVRSPGAGCSRTATTFRFTYCGYDVRVRSDGGVEILAA